MIFVMVAFAFLQFTGFTFLWNTSIKSKQIEAGLETVAVKVVVKVHMNLIVNLLISDSLASLFFGSQRFSTSGGLKCSTSLMVGALMRTPIDLELRKDLIIIIIIIVSA